MKEQTEKQTSQFLKTDGGETKSNAIEIPSISLPKGGGALKGIDEKFEVNAANGTASFSIPLPITPGRNGFSPSLALSYNSGGGNSPFGLGWSLGYPSIQRKTDKRLPRYGIGGEEDVFMFSGAEDLVPFLKKDGNNWIPVEMTNEDYTIKRYRPRIEGGFARIEKITSAAPEIGVYWKVTTKENIVTIFGRTLEARIADPQDNTHTFQWLPEFSYDDKGNWIHYHYKKDTNIEEDGKTLKSNDSIPNHLYEKNRNSGIAPFTNSYLKRITYGNKAAYYADSATPYDPKIVENGSCFFELVLDYGEHTDEKSPHLEKSNWKYRDDAFSSYRSGFEIRTNRLCKRILMFHHFKGEKQWDGSSFGKNYLVRSLDLFHGPSSINDSKQTETTYLESITQTGYIKKPDGNYSQKSLPPMEFTYEKLNWNTEIKTVSPENIVNAPVGLTNNYQWVDLYGEGISGILTEQGAGWYYKSNKGVDIDGKVGFTVAQKVISKPSFSGLSNGVLSIQDLAANGEKQIVVNSPGVKGYFELTAEENWKPFKAFEQIANVNLQDPNTRLFDLNGDGQPELVMTEENVFVWYAADGKRGHLPAERTLKTFDEEQGPAIVFADQQQTIFLADMSGDGMTDIARIRNGEICYWANKGYGKFSAKITMSNAPNFDHPDHFNPQYLHLADVSGTGATDIIYLGKNTFKAFVNLSGNAWSDVHEIEPFFPIDSNSKLSVVDLLGTGTSCIVWSSDLPAYANAPMRYIDLMDSKKPHVLIHHKNNMGKETKIEYKSSTHYYLQDKLADNPWITKLPFAVQVVSKMIVEEKVTNVRFASRYSYHHGYYDHSEREFRGFGMVEQTDTEFYETWKQEHADTNLDDSGELYQPPMRTKTWYHTGAFLDREKILTHFETEYWYEKYNQKYPDDPLKMIDPHSGFEVDFSEPELNDARLSDEIKALIGNEYREAIRACKGMVLRQEVFALDAPKEDPSEEALKLEMKPYTVATHNCNIQLLQPRNKNLHGVFIVTESEAITISYERDESDYRIAHTLNTNIDELGNIMESASVIYGRNQAKAVADFQLLSGNITDFSEDVLNNKAAKKKESTELTEKDKLKTAFEANILATQKEQTKTHIIYTKNSFAKYIDGEKDINLPHTYRLRLPKEMQTFELNDLPKGDDLYELDDFKNVFNDGFVKPIAYEVNLNIDPDPFPGFPKRRLIEHVKTKYLDDDLNALEFGFFDTFGLSFQNYQLAYTPDLVKDIYIKKVEENPGAADSAVVEIELEANGFTASTLIEEKGKYTNFEGNLWIRSGISHFKDDGETINDVKNRFFSPIKFEDPFGAETTVIYDKNHLFIKETRDAVKNKTLIDIFNYRTFSPNRMIDINANPTSVLLDELGLVKALAIEGNGVFSDDEKTTVIIQKAADNLTGLTEYQYEHDDEEKDEQKIIERFFQKSTNTIDLRKEGNRLLKHATARFVYDFDTYQNTEKQPTVVASISREEHYAINNDSKLQFSFEYSDGLGNVAMVKAQAEPGMAYYMEDEERLKKDTGTNLRWIGNGRTILNNKGNPVKQYEPYFSTNFGYEDAPELVETGVTPIMYYDAPGRLIKTTFPDGTLSRAAFDSWKQLTFDQNDTVLESDWYKKRTDGNAEIYKQEIAKRYKLDRQNDDDETRTHKFWTAQNIAAKKALAHTNTPSSLYLDSLGRPVLSIEHNGLDEVGKNRLYTTFIELDIESNAKTVIDARGNKVMAYKYDMLGHQVYQNSMDGGERWVLNNVTGNPLFSWDAKEQVFSTDYDKIQRPIEVWVQINEDDPILNEKMVYGEDETDARLKNLHGQLLHHYDGSGKISTVLINSKGSPLEIQRQLAADYKAEIIDWKEDSDTNGLEEETFTSITEYDALGRMTRLYNWHRDNNERVSITESTYNERGLVTAEDHIIKARKTADGYSDGERIKVIKDIKYDVKGQRMRIRYGNGTSTRYHYDPLTFRLRQLRTTKQPNPIAGNMPSAPSNLSDSSVLQNLYYVYDPVGNITTIEDDAYEPVFFENQKVEPQSNYTYDALYRLINAEGRENNTNNKPPTAKELPPVSFSSSRTDKVLRNYTQYYLYDPVGNILQMRHLATQGWTRNYIYATDNNQLLTTWTGKGNTRNIVTYTYDKHGNMLNVINTANNITWDYRYMIQKIDLDGDGVAYYQYDSQKERSRKYRDKGGGIKEERLYLGGMEIYRRWNGDNLVEEIETHHVFLDEQRILMVEDVIETDSTLLQKGVLYRYQYSNHLGSVGLEMNEEAKVISYEEYHPYGTVAYQAKNADIKATAKRYRYTGMERDEESGLSYHSARYYLPWLGRWCSVDPEGVVDGGNLYNYVNNRPIVLTDEKGNSGNYFDLGDMIDVEKLGESAADIVDSREKMPALDSPLTSGKTGSARKYGNTQAKRYAKESGLIGNKGVVQAGHTAAARHATESGISPADWDKQKMQELHSRKDRGLNVEVKDPKTGKPKIRTRHTAQEGMIDDSIDRVRKAQGKLTPQGQLDAADEVIWKTQGTGLDQREVLEKRASGLIDESTSVGAKKSAKKGTQKGLKQAAKKGMSRLGKALPIIGVAATIASVGYSISQGSYIEASVDVIGEIPVVGTAFSMGYAAGTVTNEFLPKEIQNSIGGTISETIENGWKNITDFYF